MTRSHGSVVSFASLGFFLPLALSGCERAGAGAGEKAAAASSENSAAKRVVVVKPTRSVISRSVTQPANVIALNAATLYAQVAGYLTEIAVDKGDPIEKDQVLATIAVPELDAEQKQLTAERAEYEAEVAQASVELERAESARVAAEAGVARARADLDLQKALYDRAKDLRGDGVISIQDLEIAEGRYKESQASITLEDARLKEAEAAKREAESKIEVAKAKVATAAANLERVEARVAYSKIRGPFKGFVGMRYVDPGAMIQQATSSSTQASRILDVYEIDRVRVDFPVPEAEVSHVGTGQLVSLRVDAWPGRSFECRVTRFTASLDPASRTLLVEAEYENKGTELRPGMFGEATLEFERHANALTLPAEAIRTQGNKKTVFVVDGSTVHKRVVKLGIDSGPVVEVVEGIAAGESVVLGSGRLVDGAPVVALERKPESAEATAEKSE